MADKYLITKEDTYNALLARINKLENELSNLSQKNYKTKEDTRLEKLPIRLIILIELAIIFFAKFSRYSIDQPENIPINILALAVGYIFIQCCLDFYNPESKKRKIWMSVVLRIIPIMAALAAYVDKINSFTHRL